MRYQIKSELRTAATERKPREANEHEQAGSRLWDSGNTTYDPRERSGFGKKRIARYGRRDSSADFSRERGSGIIELAVNATIGEVALRTRKRANAQRK